MSPDFAGLEGAVEGHFVFRAGGMIVSCFAGTIPGFIYCLSCGGNKREFKLKEREKK